MANFDDLYERMEDSANRATDAAANFNAVLTEDDETDVMVDGRPVPSMSKRIKLRLDEGMVAVDEAVAEAKAEADRAETEANRAETIAGTVGDVVNEAKAEADRAKTEADRAEAAAFDAAEQVTEVAYETLKPGNRWFDFWGLDTLDYTPLVYVNNQNHMKFDVPAVQILLDFHVVETSDFSVLRVAQDGSMLSNEQELVLGKSQFDGEPYRNGAFVGLPPDLNSIIYEQTPTYEQLIAAYDALLEEAGSAMSKRELGLDSGGQSVWCYSLKAPPRVTHNQETRDLLPKRKKAVLVGGVHAGELPGIITLYLAVRQLIQFSEQDADLALLRHSVDFEVIPVAVPASYGTARRNANGVDVNRNFDIEWEEGSDDPNSLMYRGPAPESEPETRLLLGVVSDPEVTHVIDAHAHGQTDALWWYGAATRANMTAAAISGERMTAIAYQQYGFTDNRSICFYQRNRSGGLIAYAGLTLEKHAALHESHQLNHPYVADQPSVVKRRLNEMSYLELLKSLILSGN